MEAMKRAAEGHGHTSPTDPGSDRAGGPPRVQPGDWTVQLLAPRVADVMHRTVASVQLDRTAAEAMTRIEEEVLPFLPVVCASSGEVLGVVLARALEYGCKAMGHGPERCGIENHLKAPVRTCEPGDPLTPDLAEASSAGPVVVVDRRGRPVGILRGGRDG